MTTPSITQVSYNEDSPWCQEHGHTGLLVGSVCETCDRLAADVPAFAALANGIHNPDGSRGRRNGHVDPPMTNPYDPAENGMSEHRSPFTWPLR
jgi:hypothetical protein